VARNKLSISQYNNHFSGDKKVNALEQALDIRKFEIELYWKRATYFWAFIAVTFAGYFAVLGIQNEDLLIKKNLALFLINSLGIMFSFSWFLVNRGSKFWQNNWERHVDLLEDTKMGPLYKTVIELDRKPKLYEEAKYSVSKINQLLSLYMVVIWALMGLNTLFNTFLFFNSSSLLKDVFTYESISILVLFIITILFMIWISLKGQSRLDDTDIRITKRNSLVNEPTSEEKYIELLNQIIEIIKKEEKPK
jgi:hypothetical protein